jgi:hypothetical protein
MMAYLAHHLGLQARASREDDRRAVDARESRSRQRVREGVASSHDDRGSGRVVVRGDKGARAVPVGAAQPDDPRTGRRRPSSRHRDHALARGSGAQRHVPSRHGGPIVDLEQHLCDVPRAPGLVDSERVQYPLALRHHERLGVRGPLPSLAPPVVQGGGSVRQKHHVCDRHVPPEVAVREHRVDPGADGRTGIEVRRHGRGEGSVRESERLHAECDAECTRHGGSERRRQ